MNKAGLIGIIFAISIVTFLILDATNNPRVFADMHGILIVMGGTITVALMSFNFKKLFSALKIVFRKTLGQEKEDYQASIKTIVDLAEAYRVNPKTWHTQLPAEAHPFMKDSVNLIAGYGFTADEVDEIITNAMRGKKQRDDEEVKVWHTISRFPPAFGLLGATLGMISLLQTLGEPGAQDRIGPAMATALVATFYGLVCANLILLPIAEKLSVVSASDRVHRQIIKQGILMIVERRHPTFIAEYLQSFLPPAQRKLTESSDKGASRAA